MRGRYFDWLGNPISQVEWAQLFGDERHVADDRIGDVGVSTVWLGLDHSMPWDDGPPLIFETMIFGGGDLDGHAWRYATEKKAREGHALALEIVRASVLSSPGQ